MIYATDFCRRVNVVCGHYGSGKTNLAVNLAMDLKRSGQDVTLVDLDIVNPYFRSSDFTAALTAAGIHTVNPMFANSNLDIPALTAEISGVFERREGVVILDVGGDDAGAAALGRYSRQILEDDSAFFYVVNQYRYLTRQPEEAAAVLREIEAASRLRATAVVGNSNLAGQTDADAVLAALPYARETARLLGLPLAANAYARPLAEALEGKVENGYPVDVFVGPPWEAHTALQL